ncbi:MAG: acyl-CoA thioesterase [Acidimicrobiia bacterium]|nr:acyl-CoA thioesterase [Acidimicrobiia bacterium]
MSQTRTASIDVEVRYAETDQMGVVHHAVYPVWFELARTRLCEETGFHYAEIENLGYRLMVTGLTLDYRSPARYGDTVSVLCHISRLGSRGVVFAYEIRRGDRQLASGTTTHVWIQASSNRPCRIPEDLEDPFRRLAGKSPRHSRDAPNSIVAESRQ